MGKKNPRVDAYIEKSPEFAKPILKHLRAIVHGACPQVEETIKWSVPFFDYKGPLAGMAAFKQHCGFSLWKQSLIVDEEGGKQAEPIDRLRISTLSDLPSRKVLSSYVKQAMKLNEDGVKSPTRVKSKVQKPVVVPPELKAALRRNSRALAGFEAFSPSHKREYIEWIAEAKREETRQRRLKTAVEWIAEGKSRNWKYHSR